MAEILELIRSRRSVRKLLADPLPEGVTEQLLEAIRWAPSWANTQCWEVVTVTRAETRQALQAAVGPNPAFETIGRAPLVVVFCGRKGQAGYKQGVVSTRLGDWLMYDLGIATQNLCLAAHALGLGTVIVGRFDHDKVRAILGIPEECEVVSMVPVGIPAEPARTPPRRELTELVHPERF